jgi:hypothetical protein
VTLTPFELTSTELLVVTTLTLPSFTVTELLALASEPDSADVELAVVLLATVLVELLLVEAEVVLSGLDSPDSSGSCADGDSSEEDAAVASGSVGCV